MPFPSTVKANSKKFELELESSFCKSDACRRPDGKYIRIYQTINDSDTWHIAYPGEPLPKNIDNDRDGFIKTEDLLGLIKDGKGNKNHQLSVTDVCNWVNVSSSIGIGAGFLWEATEAYITFDPLMILMVAAATATAYFFLEYMTFKVQNGRFPNADEVGAIFQNTGGLFKKILCSVAGWMVGDQMGAFFGLDVNFTALFIGLIDGLTTTVAHISNELPHCQTKEDRWELFKSSLQLFPAVAVAGVTWKQWDASDFLENHPIIKAIFNGVWVGSAFHLTYKAPVAVGMVYTGVTKGASFMFNSCCGGGPSEGFSVVTEPNAETPGCGNVLRKLCLTS